MCEMWLHRTCCMYYVDDSSKYHSGSHRYYLTPRQLWWFVPHNRSIWMSIYSASKRNTPPRVITIWSCAFSSEYSAPYHNILYTNSAIQYTLTFTTFKFEWISLHSVVCARTAKKFSIAARSHPPRTQAAVLFRFSFRFAVEWNCSLTVATEKSRALECSCNIETVDFRLKLVIVKTDFVLIGLMVFS